MHRDGVQLLLPEGVAANAGVTLLGEHLPLTAEPSCTVERTFLDTFDGRVHAAGLALVHADGRLALVDGDTYVERCASTLHDPPDRLLVGEIPAGPLRERLAGLIEMRAATPVARVRSRLHRLRVLDDEAKTVVRLVVDEPAVLTSARRQTPLRPRLLVLPVRGYGDELARVRGVLVDRLGLPSALRPLHDEAVAESGGTPGGTSSRLAVQLTPDMRADAAAARILHRLLEVVRANLPGTLDDVDSEFLHDLRVAVRRSRSAQRQLERVFDPHRLRGFRAEFRWLQQVTGPTRDLDVYLLELDELRAALPDDIAPDIDPLAGLLARRRAAEQRKMVRALRSARTVRLLTEWERFLDGLVDSEDGERPDGGRPVGEVAGRRIRAVYRRVVRMGRAIDSSSPAEELHDLRKKAKELRYLLEFFGSLYPPATIRPMVSALKSLQDVLGRFQDRQVQAEFLRSLRDDVAGLDRGAAALMAMGVLVERLGEQQAQARDAFAEQFGAFAHDDRRALVESISG